MKVENIQSQMRKGVLEYCILSIIKNGEVYPGDIIEEVKNAGLHLFEGTLYPLLNRLKNADILIKKAHEIECDKVNEASTSSEL